ncbi:hypothetical protein IJK16_02255 [Candidatus Saccharibacteria bacterium]|nr:hypothetical protein [Candidatus Saccharibacteria bacterium]
MDPNTPNPTPEPDLNEPMDQPAAPAPEQVAAPAEPVPVEPTPIEPAPAEPAPTAGPIEPAEPVASATPEPAPQPFTDPTTSFNSDDKGDIVLNRKKGKGGLIAGIIVVLLLLGGGAFYLFNYVLRSPEKVALTAITNFITAENETVNGTIKQETLLDGEVVNTTTGTFNYSGKQGLPLQLGFSVAIDEDNNAGVEAKVDSEGVIYAKLDGVDDFADLLGGDEAEAIVDLLDKRWLEINIPKITEKYGDLFGEEVTTVVNGYYGCIINSMKSSKKASNDLAELYKSNQFLTATKYTGKEISIASGNSGYALKYDTDKLANFIKGVPGLSSVKELSSCFSKYSESSSADDIADPDTIAEIKESFPKNLITIIETNGKDQLVRFYASNTEDDQRVTLDLKVTYPASINFEKPEAKSITDFIDDILKYQPTEVDYDEDDTIDEEDEDETEDETEDEEETESTEDKKVVRN